MSVRSAAWSYVLDEGARILVADDDPILREFAAVHLSTPTADVVTAADGRMAFDLLKSERFDIAILDIGMPVMDGYELLQKIRSDAGLSRLPVMMLTGQEDVASIDRAYNLGADAFSPKPVNWRLLSYQIRYVVRSSKLEGGVHNAPSIAPVAAQSHCDPTAQALWEAVQAEAAPYANRIASPTDSEKRLSRIARIAACALLTESGSPSFSRGVPAHSLASDPEK